MNDKQQLAAMGEHIAEQPLCMARRIEELEAQLAEKSIKVERLREMNLIAMKRVDGMLDRDLELSRLQSLMSEGWQLVPIDPIKCIGMGWAYLDAAREDNPDRDWAFSYAGYRAMLAASPKPEAE